MKQKAHIGKKATAIATAGAFLVAMGVPQIGGLSAASAASMSADGYVTAAASRAAQPAPEILGLSGVEETGADTGAAAYGKQDWDNPKYYIMGDATYNSNPNPNPYMVNAVSVVSKTDVNAKPTIVQNTSRAGGGRGPMGALATYGSDTTDDAVWNMKPDVVVGIGTAQGNADYTSDAYAGAAAQANGWASYSPIGVEYLTATNANIIKEMYELAEAGDKVVADSDNTKKLRYGSAVEIAKNFERYIVGTQGYILKAINAGTVSKKTVAAVSSYDEASQTFTLLQSGVAEGTASSNKLLEACEQVSDNLIDKLGKETATAEELAQADAIVIGGQSGGAGEALTDPNAIVAKMDASLVKKTYYVDSEKANPGSMYGVVMNSVENTQNIGRVLGFVYPEVVDQDDWMCYYYDKFYHIKSDKLAEVIDKAMDGVRNYDATDAASYMTWTEADASTYSADAVQAKIQEGVSYLKGFDAEQLNASLVPSSYLSGDAAGTVDISKANVVLDKTSYNADGTAKTPAISSATLPCGIALRASNYTVSYTDNTAVGTATATITGQGNYTGTVRATFAIKEPAGEKAWKRLAGNTAIGTMKAIVNEGWKTSDWAIVATTGGYYDALSASGLAGLLDCPILMTASNKLSDTTKALIQSKGVKNVIVVGGTSAVSDNTFNQIKALGVSVERVAGNTAIGTANAIYERGKTVNGGWGGDAIVATAGGYQDALSIAPYAYKNKAPIFLARGNAKTPATLTDSTLAKVKAGGFNRTIITGGTAAVASSVDAEFENVTRLAGNTAYGTSKKIANFCISEGMEVAHMGVATGKSYYDALAGAALCGKMNSVIILADEGHSGNVSGVVTPNKKLLEEGCYIFGGTSAVSANMEKTIKAASK